MEKLAYVFTNGIYAKLVVLFNNPIEEVDTEALNERVLNEVLLPNGWNKCYCTHEDLERQQWEKDEDGFYDEMTSVYGNDNREYFFYEENLIIKYASEKEIQAWAQDWVTIVELD